MQLEFHQLDRYWDHLRVRHPARQRRLLASLAESGQQVPIVVVPAEGQTDRYVVIDGIDGYKRIAALEQLGRDTAEAGPVQEPCVYGRPRRRSPWRWRFRSWRSR